MKFSIIIPTYNSAHLIYHALESVISQNYDDYEIIIVDDGSSDNTNNVVEPYCSRANIRYIKQENAGPGAARNNGIRNAKGEYIVLLDSDDLLYETCLASLARFLENSPEVDFLFTNYDIFDKNDVVNKSAIDTWAVFRTIPKRLVFENEWIFTESLTIYIIRYGGFMHTSGTTIRRELFDKIGFFKEKFFYGEDDELYARATYNSVSGYLDKVLSRKRNHPESLIHNKNNLTRNIKNYLDLTKYQYQYYSDDNAILDVISKKLSVIHYSYIYGLQKDGFLNDAQKEIFLFIQRDITWPILKILVKNYLLKAKIISSTKPPPCFS